MQSKKDFFNHELQTNARVKGQYEKLAAAVESEKCVFCDLKAKYIIKEDSGLVLTVNIFPYIDGHLMIIPRRHIENFSEVKGEEMLAYKRLVDDAIDMLDKKLGIESLWLLLRDGKKSGKTVKHLHWQVLPFVSEMVEWHYQKISMMPIDLAKTLRGEK